MMFAIRKWLFFAAITALTTLAIHPPLFNGSPFHRATTGNAAVQLAAAGGGGGLPISSSFLIEDQAADLTNPSVGYDSYRDEYWVVYQAYANQGIRAARLSGQGQVLGYTDVAYHAGQALQNPDLAYNSATHKFLVVWEYNDSSRSRIYGRILDPGGASGSEFSLGTAGALRDRYKPAVAYASTSDKFLAVWESIVWQSAGTSDVEAQIVTSSGGLEGSNFLVAIGDWQIIHYQPDLAYNRSRNEYLVA